MKANETKIDKFLATNETTFAIPVYQRNYDWTLTQCKQLLHDILEAGKDENVNAHFIGSIVYVHDDVYSTTGITELTIIDGQQRLTTITLIYITLYRIAKEAGNTQLMDRINKIYLINEYAPETEKLKLKPTENNKEALRYILNDDSQAEFKGYSKIVENFNYFRSSITAANFEVVQKGLSKLIFIDIALDRQKDNPQRIFESLNSTGLELSQADLIRNYILMGLKQSEQNKIYKNFWEPIEKLAKDEQTSRSLVSEFIRDYLTLRNKEIPNKGDVYKKFKTQYPTSTIDELEHVLSEIKSLARYYNKLINPKNESDREIRKQLQYINRLEINVSYPFLIKIYEDFGSSVIDKITFIAVLELVQSFSWRRFILGFGTESRNKIFMNLYDKVELHNYLPSIQKAFLSLSGNSRFPRSGEVIEALRNKDVYNIKAKNRTYLLDRLENFDNKEPVLIENNPDVTIEHIFPQNPDLKWITELGKEECDFIKEKYLNTIGNLTLSGNNGKLGNKPFVEKRDLDGAGYKDSRLWLNKYLSTVNKWDKAAIEKRFETIAERFLDIWTIPSVHVETKPMNEEINIFDAEDPKYRKLEYAVFFSERLDVTQVSKLYLEVFKKLFAQQPETFFTSEVGEKIGLTTNSNEYGLEQPVALNDTYFMEGNWNNMRKFERIKLALTVFGFEDELFIKYADN
jgi:uncharacterized protein with ParB-like and HNH nuclease domain